MNLMLDLNKISQYRTPLMGISAILIILCHANLYDIKVNSLIHYLLTFGNVGVDIFLFLSGIGCYYSLQNGGDQNGTKRDLFVSLFHTHWLKFHIGGSTSSRVILI